MRTISAQSSGLIISSGGIPDHSAIGVSTKPGQMATARTPSVSSSSFSVRVSEMTAAVQLVQALGGGWDVTKLPAASDVTSKEAAHQAASTGP